VLKREVNYRLAKFILANMKADGIISDEEMQTAWKQIAEKYNPPFLELEVIDGEIGDGVIVDEKKSCKTN